MKLFSRKPDDMFSKQARKAGNGTFFTESLGHFQDKSYGIQATAKDGQLDTLMLTRYPGADVLVERVAIDPETAESLWAFESDRMASIVTGANPARDMVLGAHPELANVAADQLPAAFAAAVYHELTTRAPQTD